MPAAPPKNKFPLWFHKGTGQWTRKVRGKQHYFGTDQDEAKAEWDRIGADLLTGREPRS